MKPTLRALHKYCSLIVGLLWLMQAATGTLLSIDGLLAEAAPPPAPHAAALGARLQALQRSEPQNRVRQIKRVGSGYDIYIAIAGHSTDAVRVDGAGHVLGRRPFDYDYPAPGLMQTARIFHTHLFAGLPGRYLLGLSGLLLVINIALGLQIAWPRRGQWRRWLLPPRQKTSLMTLLTWHRAAGLWLATPALLLLGAGVILAFDDPLAAAIGASQPPPHLSLAQEQGEATTPVQALRHAQQLFPRATLAQMDLPGPRAPYYSVRLRQPGETRETAGMTYVYVSARGDKVLRVYDARKAPANVAFITALYPLHTGEIVRSFGRGVSVLVGLWLLTIGSLGATLWWTKRRMRRKPAAQSNLARSRATSPALSGK